MLAFECKRGGGSGGERERERERLDLLKSMSESNVAGIKKIDPQLYEASRSRYFGRETVATIQLCSMTKPKQNEYYYIEHEVPF